MKSFDRRLWTVAAILGALGVLLGAFGAHGLQQVTDDARRLAVWRTASFHHLVHSVVLLAAAHHPDRPTWGPRCLIAGIVVFSGSLYTLALTGMGMLGAITPIGGVLFVVGWILLARGT